MKLGKYQHFKGKFYKVINIARDSKTLKEVVIYQALYNSPEFGNNALWIRDKKEFFSDVVVDNKKIPRFKFIK